MLDVIDAGNIDPACLL